MEDQEALRNRWNPAITFVWVLAAITILFSIWMISQHGFIEISTVNQFGSVQSQEQINVMVIGAAIGQSVGAILLGLLFSMVNGIHKTTTDVWFQNHRAMTKRDK